ncbi:MAG: methyltransferase domain-containing protein [Hyphomicrobiales bacterium]|nr:methyltransferase domain-containing protein [Hyphomicrobiales bacterium]
MCDAAHLTPILELAPTPIANAYARQTSPKPAEPRYPLELAMCETCGHVQLAHMVNRFKVTGLPAAAFGQSVKATAHLNAFAEDVLARIPKSHEPLIVGIGSNDGTMLKGFQDQGWRVQGVEASVNVAGQAIANDIPTFPGFLMPSTAARIAEERGRAQVVVAHQAFAVTENAPGFIQGVREMLAEDGLFVFEVNALHDLVTHPAIDSVVHATLDYHSAAPLKHFFAHAGMELIDVTRTGSQGRLLRGYAQKAGGTRAVQETVEAMIEEDDRNGLSDISTYHDLALKIAHIKAELAARLDELKTAGMRICGYGAAPGSTTLMYSLGLDAEVLEGVFDDSPLREDCRMPGTEIPILSFKSFGDHRPDWLVVLDWRNAEAIIDWCRTQGSEAMRFIIPWPELQIR